MTPSETAQLLAKFGGAYNVEVNDAMAQVWANVLATVDVRHANEVAQLYIQTEEWMPKPAEFLAGVAEAVRRDDMATMAERNTHAAYRCDGSRWRCAEHQGKCPIDCTAAQGMEPCPTCHPTMFDRLADAEMNHKWRQGGKFNDDATVVPRACIPIHEPPARVPPREAANLVDDWATTRRDVM